MNPIRKPMSMTSRGILATFCAVILVPGDALSYLRAGPVLQEQAASSEAAAPKIPPEQIDSLVAPIALYPDPMLAQVLAASTYPLEIIQLQQWLTKNSSLKDKALADAVAKQPWDASVQAMAAMPEVVKRLADDIQWTTDLGNAFLAQQADVMDAVQRMRKKAQDNGNLKSGEQQKVETKVVESKTVIVVEQANPQVVYVPSYNPTVVYGPPVYPYPPIVYPPPPSTGAVVAGMAISFGVGMAMGAAWGGGWGYGCGWGHNDVNINVNNNFTQNANINRNTNVNQNISNRNANVSNRAGTSGGSWQHNPQHRGGAPYSSQATANKYGGTARGASPSSRQASARQQIGNQGGNLASNRGGAGVSDRSVGGAGNRAGGAGISDRSAGGAGNRAGGAGVSDRSAGGAGNRAAGGGGDRVGSRDMSRGSGGGGSAFGGGSGGFSGSSARASSSRGASSMGSRGGGGASRGGGGRRR